MFMIVLKGARPLILILKKPIGEGEIGGDIRIISPRNQEIDRKETEEKRRNRRGYKDYIPTESGITEGNRPKGDGKREITRKTERGKGRKRPEDRKEGNKNQSDQGEIGGDIRIISPRNQEIDRERTEEIGGEDGKETEGGTENKGETISISL